MLSRLGHPGKGAGWKKCDRWEIQWKSAFSKRDAGQYAGQWYHPFTCLNATSHSNFTRSQVHSRSKRLSLDDMNSSFMEKVTFHWWSFVMLWNKIFGKAYSTFTDVNYKFPGISVLIDNQSFSQACRLLLPLSHKLWLYHQNILTVFTKIEKTTNKKIYTHLSSLNLVSSFLLQGSYILKFHT